MLNIKEIALKIAEEMPRGFLWYEGCGHEAGILVEEVVEFAEAFIAEIANETAEAIAEFVAFQRNDIPATGIEFAEVIRSGEWRKFVKEV